MNLLLAEADPEAKNSKSVDGKSWCTLLEDGTPDTIKIPDQKASWDRKTSVQIKNFDGSRADSSGLLVSRKPHIRSRVAPKKSKEIASKLPER